jgi:hypothetical protein
MDVLAKEVHHVCFSEREEKKDRQKKIEKKRLRSFSSPKILSFCFFIYKYQGNNNNINNNNNNRI